MEKNPAAAAEPSGKLDTNGKDAGHHHGPQKRTHDDSSDDNDVSADLPVCAMSTNATCNSNVANPDWAGLHAGHAGSSSTQLHDHPDTVCPCFN
jgi:hypothetical protein